MVGKEVLCLLTPTSASLLVREADGQRGTAQRGVAAYARLELRAVDEIAGIELGAGHPPDGLGEGEHLTVRRVCLDHPVPGLAQEIGARGGCRPPGPVERGRAGDPRRDRHPQGTDVGRGGELRSVRQHGQHQRSVLHGGGQRTVLGHLEPGTVAQVGRHHAQSRLDPDQPAAGRRDADGPHAVVSVRHRHGAGGNGGRRSTRRTAGGAVEVPRVAGDAVRRVGGPVDAQLGNAGDPDDHRRRHRAAVARPRGRAAGGPGFVPAEPIRIGSPATATLSLTATGTPASGSWKRSTRASTASASAIAFSDLMIW